LPVRAFGITRSRRKSRCRITAGRIFVVTTARTAAASRARSPTGHGSTAGDSAHAGFAIAQVSAGLASSTSS
jgi:hypothetical protein